MNIRSTNKLGLLLAFSLGALGAVSAPAFSESTEFRRGYEQGFKDATNGKRPQYGDFDRRGSRRPYIEAARYGIEGKSCNATSAVREIVEDQRGTRSGDNNYRVFSVPVSNQLCGDPAPGRQKELIVRYRCGGGDGDVKRIRSLEGSTMRIRCSVS